MIELLLLTALSSSRHGRKESMCVCVRAFVRSGEMEEKR